MANATTIPTFRGTSLIPTTATATTPCLCVWLTLGIYPSPAILASTLASSDCSLLHGSPDWIIRSRSTSGHFPVFQGSEIRRHRGDGAGKGRLGAAKSLRRETACRESARACTERDTARQRAGRWRRWPRLGGGGGARSPPGRPKRLLSWALGPLTQNQPQRQGEGGGQRRRQMRRRAGTSLTPERETEKQTERDKWRRPRLPARHRGGRAPTRG